MFKKHLCKFYKLLPFFPFSPMFSMMAVCAKGLKIFFNIIFPVSINMMHTNNCQVINSTFITLDFPKFFKRYQKAFSDICFFRSKCSVSKVRTLPGTKLFLPALKGNSSSNYLSTKLTRMSLDTRKRAIISIFAKISFTKFFSTSRTYFHNKSIFICAFFRTIDFPLFSSRIFPHKFSSTNLTFIHTMPLNKGRLLCH